MVPGAPPGRCCRAGGLSGTCTEGNIVRSQQQMVLRVAGRGGRWVRTVTWRRAGLGCYVAPCGQSAGPCPSLTLREPPPPACRHPPRRTVWADLLTRHERL
ncbi:hypothetical protein E2C01_009292 [Portunus trituberculatus]|uniref:Uncharacterized protein n=1 Tax=Portunus trituberculatus TaxID=210409 RepID=A0A5B7D4H0_PORTR|nr:hypothetical protein [Portunus trituberculatus]